MALSLAQAISLLGYLRIWGKRQYDYYYYYYFKELLSGVGGVSDHIHSIHEPKLLPQLLPA